VILIVLATTAILTAIQRIVWVYQHATGVPLDSVQKSHEAHNERENIE